MGRLNILAKLRELIAWLKDTITSNIGQIIDENGDVWEANGVDVHEDNVIPLDSVNDLVEIIEDVASYYYMAKRLRKVSDEDIKAEYQDQFDTIVADIWTTYGLDEDLIVQAKEYLAEFSVIKDNIENFVESLFA